MQPTPPTSDLPTHARERLADMRARRLFTSDLSVNEFLLVKEAGFDPLGLGEMTRALYHARELAMNRMEEEAEALGADGIVGMRLTVSLGSNPLRVEWSLYRQWQDWAKKAGFPARSLNLGPQWQTFRGPAAAQWSSWCQQMGWIPEPSRRGRARAAR